MKKLNYVFDGNRVEWSFRDSYRYYTTNEYGEGIFVVDPTTNSRKQLVGTCDFYLLGSKQAVRAKIRRWMNGRDY